MSSELDMSQYLDLFLQEAEEQLEILEQETLKLEQDPTHDRLQVIFRAAHTLKGSSRAMGFAGFADLTHEMENLLEQLRSGSLEVTTDIADALLACLDALCDLKGGIAAGQGDSGDCTALVQRLQGFTGGAAGAAVPAKDVTEPPAPQTAAEVSAENDFTSRIDADTVDAIVGGAGDKPAWHAKFRLRPDCDKLPA